MEQVQHSIHDMNVIIAKFMGYYYQAGKFYSNTVYPGRGNWFKEAKYHISWDSLMPCWARLRDVAADHFDEDYPVEYCSMCDVWALHCEHVNIHGAHKLLYDAIQWFNQQNINNGTK